MLTSTREHHGVADEPAGRVEHEVRQVAWWCAVGPAAEQPGEEPDPGRVEEVPECGEPVNAGRSTTWSRWA